MENLKNKFGLHLRWDNSIAEVLEKADNLNLNYFQCFLYNQDCKYMRINREIIQKFVLAKEKYKKLFAHASFYINFADPRIKSHALLEKELKIAQKLSFNYYVLHPGAVPKKFNKLDGIKAVANLINIYSKQFPEINFVLENMPHNGRCIGGNLAELKEVLSFIDNKDRVKICIDTAHAFVYGYNINNNTELNNFINQAKNLFSKEGVELVHLNNTKEKLASQCDYHSLTTQGQINLTQLVKFIEDKFFDGSIKILELPPVTDQEAIKELNKVKRTTA